MHTKTLLPILLLAGCGAPPPRALPPPTPKPLSGREVLSALGQAVGTTASKVERSLVFVEARAAAPQGGGGGAPAPGGGRGGRGGQPPGPPQPQQGSCPGLAISADTILLPVPLQKSQVESLKVWVAGKEFSGTVKRSNPKVGMTLVKVEGAGPLVPAEIAPATPGRGAWLVTMVCAGKDAEFQCFPALAMLRGKVAGDFEQLLLDGGEIAMGTVVCDLDGRAVGIARVARGGMGQAQVQVLSVREALETLRKPRKSESEGEDGEETAEAASPADPGRGGKPWLGAMFASWNEAYAEAEGMPQEAVLVRRVLPGSPAEKGGLQAGDLVVGAEGKDLGRTGDQAIARLSSLMDPEIGKDVRLKVRRGAETLDLTCCVEKAPAPRDFRAEDLGVQVRELMEGTYWGMPQLYHREGVVVTEVIRGTDAQKGIGPGDIVVELDGKPTPTVEAFVKALEGLRQRRAEVALLKVWRGNRTAYAAIDLALGGIRNGGGS